VDRVDRVDRNGSVDTVGRADKADRVLQVDLQADRVYRMDKSEQD
jgi:hypothetical protein